VDFSGPAVATRIMGVMGDHDRIGFRMGLQEIQVRNKDCLGKKFLPGKQYCWAQREDHDGRPSSHGSGLRNYFGMIVCVF